ncbi:hypothetical protein C8R45DRAFT_1214969, partial [Mycena sanguinolenta]
MAALVTTSLRPHALTHYVYFMASPTLQSPDPAPSPVPLRDSQYYYPGGDSIIRVENRLFKIHKAFLSHTSPVFATMFDLPAGTATSKGSPMTCLSFSKGKKLRTFGLCRLQCLTHESVNPTHVLRILSGYASLSLSWNHVQQRTVWTAFHTI